MATGTVVGGGTPEFKSGVTEGWRWKKYDDGTCEAHGTFVKKGISVNGTVSGTILRSNEQNFILPSMFTSVTSKQVTAARNGDLMWGGNKDDGSGDIHALGAYAFIITSAGYTAANVTFYWDVYGTWK